MKARIAAQHHSASQPRHPTTKRFVKQRTNGQTKSNGTVTTPITYGLQRILRPQAAFRWILPNLAAITPQYIEMILRGALAGNHVQQWELFDLMFDTWPELSACQQELSYGVLRKKLIFEPYHEEDEKPTPNAIERSKLVSAALLGMDPDAARDENDLPGTIQDILDGWFRGVDVLEVIWHTIEAKQLGTIAGPKSTFWVHPVCFAFDAGGTLGLRTTKPYDNTQWPYPSSTLAAQPQPAALEPFPIYKFLIAIHKAKSGTALGGPLLRPLAWWWCAANFSSDWLLNLAQVFGLPFRWANYDANAPQATIDGICNMLQNMGSAGWAAFPTNTTLEIINSGERGSDHSPQGELLDRADRYARNLILGQTMTGTHGTTGKGGGQAFGQVEKSVKEDRIDAAGKFVSGVLNRQLVQWVCMLNYGDSDECPVVRFLEEEEAGLIEAQRDSQLAKMGLEIGVDFLRKKYGIPEPAEGEETIGGAPEPMPPGMSGFGDQFGQGGGKGGGGDEQSIEDQTASEDVATQGKAISGSDVEMRSPNELQISVVDNHIIRGYMARISAGEQLPPVLVNEANETQIVDGAHRSAAYKKLGLQVPTVKVNRAQYKAEIALKSKLEELNAIEDDAVFARELKKLAGIEAAEEPKQQVINVHVEAPPVAVAAPVKKTFTINRADGTVIQGKVEETEQKTYTVE